MCAVRFLPPDFVGMQCSSFSNEDYHFGIDISGTAASSRNICIIELYEIANG